MIKNVISHVPPLRYTQKSFLYKHLKIFFKNDKKYKIDHKNVGRVYLETGKRKVLCGKM